MPIEFLRPIPSAALIPLLFLTLGTNLKSEVFLAAFGAFWPLLVQTIYGVRDVDPVALETARSFGLGRLERLYRITLPSAVPYIATGLRISSTVALILAFTAELFMGTPGLGQARQLRAVVRPRRRSSTRSRSRPASSASRSTSCSRRSSGARCAGIPRSGGRQRDAAHDALEDRRSRSRCRSRSSPRGSCGPCTRDSRSSRACRRSSSSSATCGCSRSSATNVVPSLERIGLGFAIAVVVGIALGIPIGLSRWARLWAMPHIEYWRAMPPPALLPISIILLHSIGNTQKVAFIAFFCIFPVLLNTIDGVRGIDPTLIETARSYSIPRRERIRRIVLPAALAADRRPGCARASRSR